MKKHPVKSLVLATRLSLSSMSFILLMAITVALFAGGKTPTAPQWPTSSKPVATPLSPPPALSDDLSRFQGYDAVVITYTTAEAESLAAMFTPKYPIAQWYKYQYNVEEFIPLVTSSRAPFNDKRSTESYHTMALYFPIEIGNAKVLLMKSGLHLDTDGPQCPIKNLIEVIAKTVNPKLFITTGTAGGIGSNIHLGDVVISNQVLFHCTGKFKNEPWANANYTSFQIPQRAIDSIPDTLTQANAAKLAGAPVGSPRKNPQFIMGTIVTTDIFAFDDSTNYYGLQGLGNCCEMDDGIFGLVMQGFPNIAWCSVRNVSDPQIPNPNNNIKAASKEADKIYTTYGGITTAASVVATWSIINTMFNQ